MFGTYLEGGAANNGLVIDTFRLFPPTPTGQYHQYAIHHIPWLQVVVAFTLVVVAVVVVVVVVVIVVAEEY